MTAVLYAPSEPKLFEPNSVEYMMSSKLRYVDVDWERATQAAARVMQAGGQVEMNVWCQPAEQAAMVAAFVCAGFKNVVARGVGVGVMLTAVW